MATLLTEAPEKAGVARLQFSQPGERSQTRRDGDTITFRSPFEELEFYALMGGDQFVAAGPTMSGDLSVVFGGTDEAPFIVGIDGQHWRNLKDGGETAFYDGLKPTRIKQLEAVFGPEGTVRQGDIWAYHVPRTWDQIRRDHTRLTGQGLGKLGRSTISVLNTRHRFEGRITRHRVLIPLPTSHPLKVEKGRLVEGVLRAPDHESRSLRGPHVLDRTPGIAGIMWIPGGD